MIRLNAYLTAQQDKALKRLAKKTGLTYSEHLRRAIDEYLEKRKKE